MSSDIVKISGIKRLLGRVVNMAFFYGGWFACMHMAKTSYPYLGPALVLILLVIHFATTSTFWIDLILVASLSLIGTIVDSAYLWFGIISFKGGYECCPNIAPLWITSLWALYASSINHSLEWLKWHYIFLAAPLGAMGAISSYLVGIDIEAAAFPMGPLIPLIIIGSVWAITVPLSLMFSQALKNRALDHL